MDYSNSKFLKNNNSKNYFKSFVSKVLVCLILFLVFLISIKSNSSLKDKIYNFVYENNISFSKFRELYNKYLGGTVPFDNNIVDDTVNVFSETIKYNNLSSYNSGVKLDVENNYLVPVLESGIVVYMGEKEGYGYTIIVQQVDGVDAWYCNINSSISLYDYVEKGTLLGDAKDNSIYLYFQKNGEFLDYKEYI